MAWHQVINWTNAGMLLIRPLGTNVNEIFTKIYLKKCIWKCRLQNDGYFVWAPMC